uniref:Secreted protein n=1 Tax=Panagrellus redivivus TaxID=6233 RepID=A0A7E4USA6_PANRE
MAAAAVVVEVPLRNNNAGWLWLGFGTYPCLACFFWRVIPHKYTCSDERVRPKHGLTSVASGQAGGYLLPPEMRSVYSRPSTDDQVDVHETE